MHLQRSPTNDGNWWTWRSRCQWWQWWKWRSRCLLTKGHHPATLIVEELIKHCQSKEDYLRKSPRQFLVYVERRDQLTFFPADSLSFGHNMSKNSALGQQKICKRTNDNWSWSIFCSPRQHLVFAQKGLFLTSRETLLVENLTFDGKAVLKVNLHLLD